jgi:hypothetical protein
VRWQACQSGCLYDRFPASLLLLPWAATIVHALVYNLYVWKLAPASTREHPKYENSFLYLSRKWSSGMMNRILNCLGPRRRVAAFVLLNQVWHHRTHLVV